MSFVEVNAPVWVRNNDKSAMAGSRWLPAKVTSTNGGHVTFTTFDDMVIKKNQSEISHEVCMPMHSTSVETVEDMATLSDMHEAAILHNIHQRYLKDNIYTFIGSILSAANPYKKLDIYGEDVVKAYNKKMLGEMPPHVFAIANEAFYSLWKTRMNQCVLISGESGAGKTESTKLILSYLSRLSKHESLVEKQIIDSSPILEAFGNAKTIFNNNSSRFGKFIKVSFNERGSIEGARILDYLLEKGRVIRQGQGERNYHIFYCLLAGLSSIEKKAWKLTGSADNYYYTNQSGVTTDPTLDDKGDFNAVREALETMGFTKEQIADVFKTVAGILHLGNAQFTNQGGAHISNMNVIDAAASCLCLDPNRLAEVLTQKTLTMRGEQITTPLDIVQAAESRDSLAMKLYQRTFSWIIARINVAINRDETFLSIGVLDIFGFENFAVNSFEQLCINFANEKLQQYFNTNIFSMEQLEYNREGINWSDIDWVDNAECLDLVEKKLGVLSLLDEESRFPKGTDASWLEKQHAKHENHEYYVKPKMQRPEFGIKHYAGEVFYVVTNFLEKNKDSFREDLTEMLQDSNSDFIYDLFEKEGDFDGSSINNSKTTMRKKPTVSFQFKESLASLMTLLSTSNPYFVRCIKPNLKKVSGVFDRNMVEAQLRYSGMLETVRIRRAGYPVRRSFEDFLYRYRIILKEFGTPLSPPKRDQCHLLLTKFNEKLGGNSNSNCQLGKTKVFMRESLENQMEKCRSELLTSVATVIKAHIMGYILRKRFLRKREAAIIFQKYFRGYRGRKAADLARAEKRRREEERRRQEELRRQEEERKRKEEEARRQKELQLEAERLACENKQAEAEALRKAAEAEKRQAEEAERARQAEDEVRKEAQKLADQKAASMEERREAKKQLAIDERRKARASAVQADKDDLELQLGELEAELAVAQTGADGGQDSDEEAEDENFAEIEKEGYLQKMGGRLKKWQRRWFLLKDGTLSYYKSKQGDEVSKAGWLTKEGGGGVGKKGMMATLSRKSWKKRWFVLKAGMLFYYKTNEEGEEALGIINIRESSGFDQPKAGSNSVDFGIKTQGRTYNLKADSSTEASEWLDMLKAKQTGNDNDLKRLEEGKVDTKNAQGTVDIYDILSIGPTSNPKVKNTFAVATPSRVYNMAADNKETMDEWIKVLQPRKKSGKSHGEATEKGWLMKEGGIHKTKKKRWFALKSDTIYYYRNPFDESSIGSIPINSLVSVLPPEDGSGATNNQWTFIVNARRRSYYLTTKTQADAQRWVSAIQDVIDSKPPIETQTEKLIVEIKNISIERLGAFLKSNPILTHSSIPIRTSLLPLPYGDVHKTSYMRSRTFNTLHEEALSLFSLLLNPEHFVQPVTLYQYILSTCFELKKIKNEVYCQLIKQTCNAPDINSVQCKRDWKLLMIMCSSFLPARKYVRYLRAHLKRTSDRYPGTDAAKCADYSLSAVSRTKYREYPPSQAEIQSIIDFTDMRVTIHCITGDSIDVTVSSFSTVLDVVENLKSQLGMHNVINGYGLFEVCGDIEKSIEEKIMMADVLAKIERYEKGNYFPGGGDSWHLYFKLFCWYDPINTPPSNTEANFMFAQAANDVVNGRFPKEENLLIKLASLQLQAELGDFDSAKSFDRQIGHIKKFYPVCTIMSKNVDTDMAPIKQRIASNWTKLIGITKEAARDEYFSVIRLWEGHGTTLFDVENVVDRKLPKSLWLGIGMKGVTLFTRGTRELLVSYPYERILSFGAPIANTYKIVVDELGAVTYETNKVMEIAKLMKAFINEIVRQRRAAAGASQ